MTITPLLTVTTITDQVRYQRLNMQKAKGLCCVALRCVVRQPEGIRLTAPEAACSPPSTPMFNQTPLQRDGQMVWQICNVYIAVAIFDSWFTVYSASVIRCMCYVGHNV